MDKWDRLNFETKLSLHDDGDGDDDCSTMVTERVDWLNWSGVWVEMILFMEEENWRRPLEQGWEIATNSTHEIMNSRTENQTCTIVKVVSRILLNPSYWLNSAAKIMAVSKRKFKRVDSPERNWDSIITICVMI